MAVVAAARNDAIGQVLFFVLFVPFHSLPRRRLGGGGAIPVFVLPLRLCAFA